MTRVVIELSGGPEDGQHLDSASPGHDGEAATDLYQFFRQVREGAKKQERMEPLDQIIRRSSPLVMTQANDEVWSEAKRRALMPYYDYRIDLWIEDGLEVLIRATYIGMDA